MKVSTSLTWDHIPIIAITLRIISSILPSLITAPGTQGWSGNIQPTSACTRGSGNESGGWRVGQHEMSNLGGQPSVRFRFAAGSVCNNYDGFAIDDIRSVKQPRYHQTSAIHAVMTIR